MTYLVVFSCVWLWGLIIVAGRRRAILYVAVEAEAPAAVESFHGEAAREAFRIGARFHCRF